MQARFQYFMDSINSLISLVIMTPFYLANIFGYLMIHCMVREINMLLLPHILCPTS